jgi:hypothetical protein
MLLIIFDLLKNFSQNHNSNMSGGRHEVNGKKLSFFKIVNIYYSHSSGMDLLSCEVFSMVGTKRDLIFIVF